MALIPPNDRLPGHVCLSMNGKHWIFGSKATKNGLAKNQRHLKRLFYRICKAHGLHPKCMKDWWHYG